MKTFEIKLSDRETPCTVQALDIGKALTLVVGERLLRAHFSHINVKQRAKLSRFLG